MQKWEYARVGDNFPEYYFSDTSGEKRVKVAKNDSAITFINDLGRQGWEMINFQQMQGSSVTVFFFKRLIE